MSWLYFVMNKRGECWQKTELNREDGLSILVSTTVHTDLGSLGSKTKMNCVRSSHSEVTRGHMRGQVVSVNVYISVGVKRAGIARYWPSYVEQIIPWGMKLRLLKRSRVSTFVPPRPRSQTKLNWTHADSCSRFFLFCPLFLSSSLRCFHASLLCLTLAVFYVLILCAKKYWWI